MRTFTKVVVILGLVLLLGAYLSPANAQDDDTTFTSIFGERPFGPRDLVMKHKQMIWDAQKARFGGLFEKEFPVDVLLLYQQWGLGVPVAWRQTNGDVFVAFPEARYAKPVYMPLSTVELFPGTIGRTWHMESVAQGFCVMELDHRFPGSVLAKNDSNCTQ